MSPTFQPFRTRLELMPGRLQWTFIRVPENVAKHFAKYKPMRVKGEINGIDFRGGLFRDASGGHLMLVTKKMQRAAGVRAGGSALFRLQPDLAPRKLVMPTELTQILREERELAKFFASLNPSM